MATPVRATSKPHTLVTAVKFFLLERTPDGEAFVKVLDSEDGLCLERRKWGS